MKTLAKTGSTRRPKSGRERGQELVEYALVFPLLMLLVLGIIEFGVVIFSFNTIANAAREGARCGIIPGTDLEVCRSLAEERALSLDPAALQVNATRSESTVQVEVLYDAHLLTAPIVQALGGNPTLPLRAISTMYIE